MGDAADALLDGDCCQECGVFIEEGGDGFPQTCGSCRGSRGRSKRRNAQPVQGPRGPNPLRPVGTSAKGHIKGELSRAPGGAMKMADIRVPWIAQPNQIEAIVKGLANAGVVVIDGDTVRLAQKGPKQ